VITLYDHDLAAVKKRRVCVESTTNNAKPGAREAEMIVEATNYFAKNGNVSGVLEQRRRATAIRVSLGLDAGRILVKIDGDGPDVRWECAFASQEEYDADRAARKTSAAFEASRKQMLTLVDRFERHIYMEDDVPSLPGAVDAD
jgi:hypothetical protein